MTTTATSARPPPSPGGSLSGSSPSSADLLITPSFIESLLYPLQQFQRHQQQQQHTPPASLGLYDHAPHSYTVSELVTSTKVARRASWGVIHNQRPDLSKLDELKLDIESSVNCSPTTFTSCSSSSSNSPLCSVLDNDASMPSFASNLKNKTSAWRKVRSLVTSPFMQTYKRQKYPWIQLAGHQGNFKSGKRQGTILKKLNGNEDECFRKLMTDALSSFVPVFHAVQTLADEAYLELEDLLANFHNPSIMDVKMGTRTYLEEELIKAGEKPKLRKDMYEKMVAIDPDEPSSEEHSLKGVTKPRYMVWRETISSTSTLGFRIDGIRVTGPPPGADADLIKPIKDFKRTKTEQSVCAAIRQFTASSPKCAIKYLERLRTIRKTIEQSHFFRTHEVIGSSLLFVHDDEHADVWLIDFAKTYPLPENVSINHRGAWSLGNHEDGYLTGLDNLIRIFSQMIVLDECLL